MCRRERPHPEAQLTFTDHEGFRFRIFITDQEGDDLAQLEARHRARAHVEDRIRCGKDTGLRNFPFRQFAAIQIWLEVVLGAQDLLTFFQRLCLDGEARAGAPEASLPAPPTSPAGWSAAVGVISPAQAPGDVTLAETDRAAKDHRILRSW
jgi:hypothetical protein